MKKLFVVLLIAALAAIGVWRLRSGRAETADEAEKAAKVETAPLQRRSISQHVQAFGVVVSSPAGDQVIAAPYDCVVRAVRVSPGATVSAGDVLLEIAPSHDAKLALESARSAQNLADKSLAATQQRYDLKLANSQDLLTAQQAAEDARLKFASLQARGVGGNGQITATAAGVVSKLDPTPGTFLQLGTALVTITSTARLEAKLGVEPADAAALAEGRSTRLTSANRPDTEPIAGSVRSVGSIVDPVTGLVEVRVPIPENAPLHWGEHVLASIEEHTSENALVAPRSAILPDDDKQILFTIKAGKAVKHEVKVGIASDDAVEVIADGLQAGEPVVTLGNYELEDGMAIQGAEPPAEGGAKGGDAKGAKTDSDEDKPASKADTEKKS